jgi:hypothetical protein
MMSASAASPNIVHMSRLTVWALPAMERKRAPEACRTAIPFGAIRNCRQAAQTDAL